MRGVKKEGISLEIFVHFVDYIILLLYGKMIFNCFQNFNHERWVRWIIGGLVLCMSKGFQWFLWLMYLQLPFLTLKTSSSILIVGRIVVGVINFFWVFFFQEVGVIFNFFFFDKEVGVIIFERNYIIEITFVLFLTNQFYYI